VLLARRETWDIARGPEATLAHVGAGFDDMLEEVGRQTPVWGATIGVPGPVDFASGEPVSPPIMPGWDGFDIRGWVTRRYDVPVWVDNDVNLMAMGELVHGTARGVPNALYVKAGTGIGAGIVAGGQIQRGATGSAGDIGHIAVTDDPTVICRCGQTGCLEAVAGGWALAQAARGGAEAGRSPWLAAALTDHGEILAHDIAQGARNGDPLCVEMIARAGRVVGESLATLVNILNPSVVTIGGTIADSGNLFLAAVRETVYRRCLPLATRDLSVVVSSLNHYEGIIGGASLALDRIFTPHTLERWVTRGSPLDIDRSLLYSA
jgi:glucokinase-like ROK family protein